MVAAPRRCPAITKGGEPCRITPQEGFAYCVWHDPERQEEAARKRQQGGYNRSREARAKKLRDGGLANLGDLGTLILAAELEVYRQTLPPDVFLAMCSGARVYKDLSITTELADELVTLREDLARQRAEIDRLLQERAS